MRKFIKITALVCALLLVAGCGQKNENLNKTDKKDAVVSVNKDNISKERFNYYYYSEQDEVLKSAGIQAAADIPADFWTQKTDGKTNLDIAKEKALASAIDDILKYQKALEADIKITSEERQMITSQIAQMTQNEQVVAQLEQIGTDMETYEQLMEESLYIQKLALLYANDGTIKLDNDAMQDEFENTYIKAQHILFMTTDSSNAPLGDTEVAEKKALANDVLARIRAGEDFDELMQEYCEDPGIQNAPDGYVFTEGQMVEPFENAAYSLSVGSVSGLVESDFGFHIIKRVPFDMEAEQESFYMDQIKTTYALPELDTLTKEWKSEADIKINDKVLESLKPIIVGSSAEK